MVTIKNRIDDCAPYVRNVRIRGDGKLTNPLDAISYITIHRADPIMMGMALKTKLTNDIVGVAKGDFMIDGIGSLAYPLAVLADGTVEQGRPLSHCTPHSKRRNASGLAVVIVGNADLVPPTKEQWESAVELVAMLCRELARDVSYTMSCDESGHLCVEGHDEVPGGSSDPGKRCPGRFWPMREFRTQVASKIGELQAASLPLVGVVI